jgi:hypothetical protein
MPSVANLVSFLRSVESHRSGSMEADFSPREHAPAPIFIASDVYMTAWMSVGLPRMHVVEWAAVAKVGSRSRGTKPVPRVLFRQGHAVTLAIIIIDCYMHETHASLVIGSTARAAFSREANCENSVDDQVIPRDG